MESGNSSFIRHVVEGHVEWEIVQRGVNLFELFAKHQPGVSGYGWLQPGQKHSLNIARNKSKVESFFRLFRLRHPMRQKLEGPCTVQMYFVQWSFPFLKGCEMLA